jgi:hypothetical protein
LNHKALMGLTWGLDGGNKKSIQHFVWELLGKQPFRISRRWDVRIILILTSEEQAVRMWTGTGSYPVEGLGIIIVQPLVSVTERMKLQRNEQKCILVRLISVAYHTGSLIYLNSAKCRYEAKSIRVLNWICHVRGVRRIRQQTCRIKSLCDTTVAASVQTALNSLVSQCEQTQQPHYVPPLCSQTNNKSGTVANGCSNFHRFNSPLVYLILSQFSPVHINS